MRKSEILSIRLANIDLDRRIIYIPKAKAGAREQPITKSIANYLSGSLQTTEPDQVWLFPSKQSKNGHITWPDQAFRSVVKAAGLDPKQVVIHTLRHTAITHLVQAGVDLPTVQRISGHKTLQMVARYSHQNGEHIQSAMDMLEQRYNAVFETEIKGQEA
jgi:integrase